QTRGFYPPVFHDERLFAKANGSRVGAEMVLNSVVVVFVEKFGLGKIRFVRLSGSRRLVNFANWVSLKKPRSSDRWQSPNLCSCLICDSHLHRFSEFFRTPPASRKTHHRHPAEPASRSCR